MSQPLTLLTIALALLAALMLIGFWIRRPALDGLTKLLLLVAMGVLPIGAAVTGNVAGLENMKERRFCGSCHNMVPYASDAGNSGSFSTAALHSRNKHFGEQSCFTCHRDYGMYGGVVTKLDGLKHVYAYYVEGAKRPPKLYKPDSNERCIRCHSTTVASWRKVSQHQAALEEIRENGVSCVRSSCHGPVHGPARETSPSALTEEKQP